MTVFLTWYLILELLGLIALPITFRVFRWLPDRGYAFSKPLGLLLTGYGLWLLVSFGFLRNTRIAIIFVMLLVAALAAYLGYEERAATWVFLKRNRRLVVATEVLFFVGFALWTLYRAYNPELDHTEKPMELAFLNAIRCSETFPPHDPWLAGYPISYYYFGYVLAAMLTKLSGVPSAVAFNVMIGLLFALTVTGAYGLTYELVETLRKTGIGGGKGDRERKTKAEGRMLVVPLLGPLLVAVIGNLEGFLDVLHSRGIGPARFWAWLDIQEINTPPIPGGWLPVRGWWWWRASRVITQRNLLGDPVEIIDEFPFFSFMLGDMHPHVLALPFAMLALGLALNTLLGFGREEDWLPVPRTTPSALLLPLIVGSFTFLHSWDFPTYFALVIATYGMRRYLELGAVRRAWLQDVGYFAMWLGVLSLLLFLPYHVGPRPYTGGIRLVGLIKTKLRQYVVMLGLFLFVAGSLVAARLREWWRAVRRDGVRAVTWGVAAIALPVTILSLILGWWTAAFLALFISLTVIVLLHDLRQGVARVAVTEGRVAEPTMAAGLENPISPAALFTLLLVATGLGLTFATEFFFVRDRFGSRMNTIFKLYYQAWVMLALASAFGVYYLLQRWRGVVRWAWMGALVVLLLMGMVYPVAAGYTRAGRFQRSATLDGLAYLQAYQPSEYAAIQWLNENVTDAPVVLEAPGGSYRPETNRISSATGLPTLLGWDFHEFQWWDVIPEKDQREKDTAIIYQSTDVTRVQQLLDKYDIEYVVVGPFERQKYGLTAVQINKFDHFMERVFDQDSIRIYHY